MKITFFNPYFQTLGGGEKVLVAMAERLSQKHEVTVLVKQPVDVPHVERYFNVDLSRVTFTPLPRESFLVRAMTSRYAKFPGRWKSLIYDYAGLRNLKKMPIDLFINSLYQSSLPNPAPEGLYLCMFPQKLEPGNIYHNAVRRLYNRFTTRLEAHFLGSRAQAIASYTMVAANSRYTAGWVKKYWGRPAKILYPVCDDMGPAGKKKNIILNVGRFFADNGSSHHKRQDELIKAFIRLNRPDCEFHLAGSAASDPASQDYLQGLRALAKGHKNVVIHTNISYAAITKLYREATVYWHATGYGYSGEIFPENQEHFGMSTVEAMSAGAVPVVFKSAGQLEVVEDNKSGLLWEDLDQLAVYTAKVLDDAKLRHKLAAQATMQARKFGRDAFFKRVDDLILEIEHAK